MIAGGNRQPSVAQQQPNVPQAHQPAAGTTHQVLPNNVMLQRLYLPAGPYPYAHNSQQYNGNFSQQALQYPFHSGYVQYHQPQQGTETPHLSMMNSVQGNSQLHTQRPPPHQQLGTPLTVPQLSGAVPQYLMQAHPRQKQPGESLQKRVKNPLAIINPKTNEWINKPTENSSGGTNTHSSALKIEAPSPAHTPSQNESQSSQQPPNSRTMPSAQSTSDGSATSITATNDVEQPTCKFMCALHAHTKYHETPGKSNKLHFLFCFVLHYISEWVRR